MTSTVGLQQPRRSMSGDSLSFVCSDFVHLRRHFPAKEICQERDTATKSKSIYHSGDGIRNGKDCSYLSLDSKRTLLSPQKSRLCDLFQREITEKNDSKSMKNKKKPTSKQFVIHSDHNEIAAFENRMNGSARPRHHDANGTAHSKCRLTHQRDPDIKHPLTSSLGMETARSIRVIHTPKLLSNGVSNTALSFMNVDSRESWHEDNTENDFEVNSVQSDDALADDQAKNHDENVGQCANGKSSVKETFYDSAGDHAAADSMTTVSMTNDSTASYASAAAGLFHPGTGDRSLGNFNSENNGVRASYRARETTDMTIIRNDSPQEKLNSDKVSENIIDNNYSRGVNRDVMKQGSNDMVDHNPRRVIRVVSLKDKDFMSRAKRNNTNCRLSRSHSSSVQQTHRSTNEGDIPPSQPITRLDCMAQEIALRSKFEEVSARRSRMAAFEEASRKPENSVGVEVNVNLLPQTIATGVGDHESWSTEKETLTIEKVQGKNQLDSNTVKSILTGNGSVNSQGSRELESKTTVVEGQWISPKIDGEKQYTMSEKQDLLQTGVSVKMVSDNEKKNPNGSDEPERGLAQVSRNNQLPLHDKSDIMKKTDATTSECFDETLQNKDNEHIESCSKIHNLVNHNLAELLSSESSRARKRESLGGIEPIYDVNKETQISVTDVATEMANPPEKCLESVTKMVEENTSHSLEEERDRKDPQSPISAVKSEAQFVKKQRPTRRVRRAVTVSATSDEITEALWKFVEVSAEPGRMKDVRTQSENNLDVSGQSHKDGARIATVGDPKSKEDSLGSGQSHSLERNNYGLEPRLCMRPLSRRPLSRSNTVITDDRRYLKQLSEEVRTLLILDARQRKLSATDETHRDHRTSLGENQTDTNTERKSRPSNRLSEKVICPRYLNSIDIIKLETLLLENRDFGNDRNKEGSGEVYKIHKKELREAETRREPSSKHGEGVSPAKTSCNHALPEVIDSVVVHEFTELISASPITNDNTYIASELPDIGNLFLNRDNDQLFESDDLVTRAIKSMVILAASEQYMKQVEAQAVAEYEELRRRPRNDGKVFLPRRPLHQKSLPENESVPL